MITMSNKGDTGKSYHRICTGEAFKTAEAHSQPADYTLFASCFCPFVQRAWIALDYLGIDYRYYEVDPYTKPKPAELLEVSPKGLVPALRFESTEKPRSLNESTVIVEYLEDLASTTTKRTLLPPASDPYARALVRLQADHIGRALVPAFYRYLQAQDPEKQIEGGKEFNDAIENLIKLFERAKNETDTDIGLWRENGKLGLADVLAGPWLLRATSVLVHYRGYTLPEGPQFRTYLERLFSHPTFKATTNTDQLYLDSYERYAYNRPNTSQVANAINAGRALP